MRTSIRNRRWDSSVSIVNRLQAERLRSIGSIPSRVRDFFLLRNIYTGSGDHPVPYTMDTEGCFLGGKMAGA
jgi:hypothetical protein